MSRAYTAKEIDDELRMRGDNRKVSFRYDLLNRYDIGIGTLDGIIAASITYGELRPIKRTATFTLDEHMQKAINFLSDRIQPWFILHMQDSGTVSWPLGIFLLESPAREINGSLVRREINAYDKTIILEQDRLESRYFIPANANYVGEVTKLLNISGITRVNITASNLTLSADREFATGEKIKDVINDLLKDINYNSLGVDSEGFIRSGPYIEPALRPVTIKYKADRDSILAPEFVEDLDIASRANVFVRVATNIDSTPMVSKFANTDPLSPISTVNRGRRIVDFEEIDNIANQGTLDNLVRRIAIESTSAYSHFSFSTALMPIHDNADTIYVDIPQVFPEPMKFSETGWEMDLKYDGLMSHDTRRVIKL